jgi:large subunit ribosomal protein L5
MLQEKYKNEILPKLMEEFAYKSVMQVPKISKIVVNVGFGRQTKEKAYVQNVLNGLARITGQKAVENKAKKAISAFKIREGMVIGASCTLRGKRMNDFLTKLINLSFPGVRDFRGITNRGMDSTGNMTIGFKEYLAFPEIRSDEIDNVFGLEISLATTAKTKKEGLRLFELYGFPFKKN